MMKIKNKFAIVEIALVVGGILLTGGGARWHVPFFVNVGVMIAAVGCMVGGIGTLRSPRFSTTTGEEGTRHAHYTYSGLSAVLWGICMLLVGAGLLGFAVIRLMGLESMAIAYFKQHPGLIWLGAGLGLVSYSLHEALGAHEENRVSWAMLNSLPARVFFLGLTVVGLALGLAGTLELTSPAAYHRLIQHITAFLPQMPE